MESYYENKLACQWILASNNDYFSILEEKLEGRKTPILHICSKLSGNEIGEIKWYGAWRKFCFFPNKDTIWDDKCLTSLNEFLIQYNKDWRNRNGN